MTQLTWRAFCAGIAALGALMYAIEFHVSAWEIGCWAFTTTVWFLLFVAECVGLWRRRS